MNLSSLSSELNISIQELRNRARAAGFAIHPRANKIENDLANKILQALGKKKEAQTPTTPSVPTRVQLPAFIKVKDFAEILRKPVVDIIRLLIKNGIMATINEEIDYDTAAIIASDLGFEATQEQGKQSTATGMAFLEDVLKNEDSTKLMPRSPIVAVMGHVDHGKTTLLDAIRTTDVASQESGGITQHIGAYQVHKNNKSITFLDTPGHEAFSEMRARGANVTDIIVLVVAADDGVRPQTVEVVNRAKFTGTPMIIAINKIDKEGANSTRVLQELSALGIITESWGGETIAVEISAKQNKNIDKLLEMILLQAEIMNLQANPSGKLAGTIIESNQSLGLGAVATVIIQNGTMKVGDTFVCGASFGKVKSLEDERGKKIKAAIPGMPVEMSGFSGTPEVGDILQGMDDLEEAKQLAFRQQRKQRTARLRGKSSIILDQNNKTLNLILKADVAGSLQAITQSFEKLKNNEVKINIVSEGIGEINESDVLLAASSRSTILAFRVKASSKAQNLAKLRKVVIDEYDVIYELIEQVTSAVIALFTPEFEKTTIGRAKVLAIFRTEKQEMIIGGKVEEGEIRKNKPVAIWRDGVEIGKGTITELQQSKVAAKEVNAGSEFGMKVTTSVKIKEGDVIESFDEVLKKKTL
ncbi:MAG TPA: translation initiation factor IF-2 [Patescibacteria group bacterium]|nr:translation initiation factor IF-2 [Patescibacteria group bacterium]